MYLRYVFCQSQASIWPVWTGAGLPGPSLPEFPGEGSLHRQDHLAVAGRGYFEKIGHCARPDPASERSHSLSLRQGVGRQAIGGVGALFRADPLEDRTGSASGSRWTADAAFGFPAFLGALPRQPAYYADLATGACNYSLRWRLTLKRNAPGPGIPGPR